MLHAAERTGFQTAFLIHVSAFLLLPVDQRVPFRKAPQCMGHLVLCLHAKTGVCMLPKKCVA